VGGRLSGITKPRSRAIAGVLRDLLPIREIDSGPSPWASSTPAAARARGEEQRRVDPRAREVRVRRGRRAHRRRRGRGARPRVARMSGIQFIAFAGRRVAWRGHGRRAGARRPALWMSALQWRDAHVLGFWAELVGVARPPPGVGAFALGYIALIGGLGFVLLNGVLEEPEVAKVALPVTLLSCAWLYLVLSRRAPQRSHCMRRASTASLAPSPSSVCGSIASTLRCASVPGTSICGRRAGRSETPD
jgi:hypothetical protein